MKARHQTAGAGAEEARERRVRSTSRGGGKGGPLGCCLPFVSTAMRSDSQLAARGRPGTTTMAPACCDLGLLRSSPAHHRSGREESRGRTWPVGAQCDAGAGEARAESARAEAAGAGSSHFAQRRTAQLAAAGAAPVNHWFLRASSPAIALIYRLQEPMSAGRACARTWLQLLASRGVCRSFRTGDDHSDGRPGTTSRLASEITYIWKWRRWCDVVLSRNSCRARWPLSAALLFRRRPYTCHSVWESAAHAVSG